MAICCVDGCSNQTHIKRKSGVTFHRFPRNKTLREQWIKAVRRQQWQPSRYTVICSEHFDEKFINRTSGCGRVELRSNAIPTIFPSYPPHLQPPNKTVRKPPRPRNSEHGEVSSTEGARADVMDVSEPSTKDVAIQVETCVLLLRTTPSLVQYQLNFDEKFINRTSGCGRVELRSNAIPTIFPSYPPHLQPPNKTVRKPPRPRNSELIVSGEVNTEGARAEVMDVSEPSPKDIAIQANDLTLENKVTELENKNRHLEWKLKQLERRIIEKSKVNKNLRKQNKRLNLRISSVTALLDEWN